MSVSIESVSRLDVGPGDVVLVKLAEKPTMQQANDVRESLRAQLPDGVRAFVTHADLVVLHMEGKRMVPVWMSDEIYLELIGGSTPIRPMRLVPSADGGFDLVVSAPNTKEDA